MDGDPSTGAWHAQVFRPEGLLVVTHELLNVLDINHPSSITVDAYLAVREVEALHAMQGRLVAGTSDSATYMRVVDLFRERDIALIGSLLRDIRRRSRLPPESLVVRMPATWSHLIGGRQGVGMGMGMGRGRHDALFGWTTECTLDA